MRDKMNICVNGQSRVPPGFRFHPTEEELLQYYLRKKVANDKIDLDFILEVDLNNLEPWDIQERCKIETTPQNDWYFFSHKDKKYPTGTRTNRATAAGFWKATGRDRIIYSNSTRIGMRKTLVFYKGRAPHGLKSDWIMHEYRLLDDDSPNHNNDTHVTSVRSGDCIQEGWVVCRIFKKRNHLPKALDNNPINKSNMAWETNSSSIINSSSDDHDHLEDDHDDYQGALEQIYQCMGGKPLNNFNNNNIDTKLSCLENPNSSTNFLVASYYQTIPENDVVSMAKAESPDLNSDAGPSGLGDWATIDKLVASHLNGQTTEEDTMAPIFSLLSTDHHHHYHHHQHDIDLDMDQLPPLRSSSSSDKIYHPNGGTTLDHYSGTTLDYHYGSSNDIDLWSFTTRSSSSSAASFGTDPLCHVSKSGIQRKN